MTAPQYASLQATALGKSSMLDNKTILITGGTGSFGRAFTAAVMANGVQKLIIFSRDELKQYQMRQVFDGPNMRYFIGDVRDLDRLRRAMTGVDYVIHAAAMKQVPACEYNPFEAVKTNVLGAQHVITAAIENGVQRVIALSSDKAVEPVNLYGATKLVAEKLFIQGNVYSSGGGARFSCVRYGNVMGSRGSVVPLFLEQRKAGVLTITDEQMTRFWITLSDAVSFVIKRLMAMSGGEVFIPRMPSMRVVDLAKALAPTSQLKFIGIRPGEKIHELLISKNEAHRTFSGACGFYVILPAYDSPAHAIWRSSPVPASFWYGSDNNSVWLSPDDLKKMVKEL